MDYLGTIAMNALVTYNPQRKLTIMSAAIRSPVGTVPLKAGVSSTLSPTLLPAQDNAVLRLYHICSFHTALLKYLQD